MAIPIQKNIIREIPSATIPASNNFLLEVSMWDPGHQ
jgi:hypothetical protein